MNRRSFLQTMLAASMAPAIVKAENIMPIFVRRDSGLLAPRFMDDLIRRTTAYDIERNSAARPVLGRCQASAAHAEHGLKGERLTFAVG